MTAHPPTDDLDEILQSFGREAVLISTDGTARYEELDAESDDLYHLEAGVKTRLLKWRGEAVIAEVKIHRSKFDRWGHAHFAVRTAVKYFDDRLAELKKQRGEL